jgi:hypothetical protein
MGVEEPPREFVLKDKTWSGFTDLLFDIYKEMASDKGYTLFILFYFILFIYFICLFYLFYFILFYFFYFILFYFILFILFYF